MPTITIPKVRKESTVLMYVSLTDNGVAVDWTSLSEIKPFMYSDVQHCIAGRCTAEITTGSPQTLLVRYPTTAPQFLGQNSLLIRCTYDGNEKSFDVPVLEFVDRSSEATGVVVLDDPELDVAIEVQDVDTSILDDAIAAALDAAARATAAAELVPLDILQQCQAAAEAAEAAAENCAPIIGQNGNWWIYDYDTSAYVDSGEPSRGETGATGPIGPQGLQGIQGNTGSSVDYPYELINNLTTDDATKGLSAAQGVVLEGEISQLEQDVIDIAGGSVAVDLSSLTQSNGVINNSGWAGTTSTVYKHAYLPVSPGEMYEIVAGSNNALFAAMKQQDTSPSNGDTPSYCDACSIIEIAAGSSIRITIPGDCTYLFIETLRNGTDKTPIISKIIPNSIDSARETELGATGIYYVGQLKRYLGSIVSGVWKAVTAPSYAHVFMPVSGGEKIRITSPSGGKSNYVPLKTLETSPTVDTTPSFCDGYTNAIEMAAGASAIVTIPSDAHWLYILTRWNSTTDNRVPASIYKTSGGTVQEQIDQLDDSLDSLSGQIANSFNSQLHSGLTDWQTPCERFSALLGGDEQNNVAAVEECEGFLFFTDPHTQHTSSGWDAHFEEYMAQIQKVYNSVPASFALCGGDWLGNGDTPDEAAYKLGLVAQTCYTMLSPCYLLVGNHDTNYQGKKDDSSENYTTRLPIASLDNLWYYRNARRAYYDFYGRNTRFFCFDTQVETTALTYGDNYGYEQAEWFANQLLSSTDEHIALAYHIYWRDDNHNLNPIAEEIMRIASAYNSRAASVTVNGTAFDFSSKTGRVEFAIAGHMHEDADTVYNNDIPVIMTIDTGNDTTFPTDASFDLVFVDYDNRQIKCIRVGSGSDRTISLDVS